jgi:hypothetical protein
LVDSTKFYREAYQGLERKEKENKNFRRTWLFTLAMLFSASRSTTAESGTAISYQKNKFVRIHLMPSVATPKQT